MRKISDLASLIEPLSVPEFRDLLCVRQPKLVRGGDAGVYASLLDWESLMETVLSGAYPAEKLRLTQMTRPVPPLFYRSEAAPKAKVIEQIMTLGGSIVAYGIDQYVPAMADLCAAIGIELGEHVVGSAIATTGSEGALPTHYDDTDILILQVEGRKRWVIGNSPVIDPVAGMRPLEGDIDQPLLNLVLEPGDILFLPAGFRHRCEPQSPRSLHLGFFFYPLTVPRIFDLLMRKTVHDDGARKPLRFVDGRRSTVEAELKKSIRERVEQLSLDDLIAAHMEVDVYPTDKM